MLSHLKRRMGVVTAVAVMAALVPVLAASPASAAASATTQAKADTTLGVEACPTSAGIASAGFSDTTSTDVDCIKSFGITTGVTADLYEPDGTVPRWQMALFLTRMATKMGVTLTDTATDFTDISGESAEIQTAIAQIKNLGVTLGTTTTTYSPDDNVTREQMAMFIERLLGATAPGPNGNSDDTLTTNISGNATTYNYADIDTGVTYEGHNSIVELYHLGVTDDVAGATAYRPSADMTRAEMATFMTRALAHSNARPAGLVIQATYNATVGAATTASLHELHVSNRDASHGVIADSIVDVFAYRTSVVLDNAAFGATNLCQDTILAGAGSVKCYMESSDHVTNQSGNIEIQMSGLAGDASVAESKTVQFWAWTGALAASYVDGTTTASTTTVTASYAGDLAHISTSHPYASQRTEDFGPDTQICMDAKYGSDVTITVQLTHTLGAAAYAVADAGVSVGVQSSTGLAYGGATAASDIQNSIIVTDAAGTATFTASMAEATALDANDDPRFQYVVFSNSAAANTAAGKTTIGDFTSSSLGMTAYTSDGDNAICIKWDDEVRDETTVVAAITSGYVTASGLAAGSNNTVTGSLYDQYGVGIANATLGLQSVDGGHGGTTTASTFTTSMTTNSAGTATWGVNRVQALTDKETFRVNDNEDNNASASTYWVVAPNTTVLDTGVATSATATFMTGTNVYGGLAADGQPEAAWVVADTANNKLVADIMTDENPHVYTVYTYDSNDSFVTNNDAQTEAEWEYAWLLIPKATNGVLTAADDWGLSASNGGIVIIKTTSYVSNFMWVG